MDAHEFKAKHKPITGKQALAMVAKMIKLCKDLPEAFDAQDDLGHTSMRVGKKPFVMMGEKEGVGHMSIKADKMGQEFLIATSRFRKTPYIGQHGWVTVVDVKTADWDEIKKLVTEAYKLAAPKRLIKILENQ